MTEKLCDEKMWYKNQGFHKGMGTSTLPGKTKISEFTQNNNKILI